MTWIRNQDNFYGGEAQGDETLWNTYPFVAWEASYAQTVYLNADYEREVHDVFDAWEQIPDRVFEEERNRSFALSTAIREGFFRQLVILRAEHRPINEFLIEARRNAAFSRTRNHRDILRDWLAPLREPKSLTPTLHGVFDRSDQFVAEGDEEAQQWSRGSRELLVQIDRQKAAIVDEMKLRRFDRVERFISDLIDFQLRMGDPIHACKSLCDLAMKAKGLGLQGLQLALTRRSIELKPDDGWSWSQYGDALLRTGQLADALSAYDRAVAYAEFPDNVVARNGRAEVLKSQNRLEESLRAYDETIAEFPDNVVARNGRAEVLKSQNRLEESLRAYDETIATFPDDVVARNGRAEVLKSQNRLEESLRAYEETIAEFPDNVVARNGRAEVLKAQNRLEESLRVYEETIAEFPNNVVARNGRAEVLKTENRLEESLRVFEETIAEFPDDVVARTGRAEVLKSQNHLEESLRAYEEIIAEFPADVVAWTGRAEVLKAQNRLEESLRAYE